MEEINKAYDAKDEAFFALERYLFNRDETKLKVGLRVSRVKELIDALYDAVEALDTAHLEQLGLAQLDLEL
ncbi:hypothetical protein [Sulfurimonas sp.]|uniref:hypothetical protein n=1 Tax=Sulfurimonas sp. TaxID=2022749 RepID=UPI003D0AED1B